MEKNRNYMHAFFFCFCRFWQLQKEAISAIMKKRTANQTGRGITGKYKIRTMENSFHIDFWKALKASPTPMTFSEVYIGLQQGTIDAEENPYEVIVSNRLYEQQKYIVETNHLPHLISLIVNDDFYQELPEETKTIINEAAQTAKIKARQASDERIEEKMKVIEESGTEIITLSDELHQQIREAAQPVYDVIGAQVDKDIVTAYLSD